jgi:hypothetical protein
MAGMMQPCSALIENAGVLAVPVVNRGLSFAARNGDCCWVPFAWTRRWLRRCGPYGEDQVWAYGS